MTQFNPHDAFATAHDRKMVQGQLGYYRGITAENIAARRYVEDGYEILEERWRGRGGEIDLIFLHGDTFIFCEVKAARTVDAAISRLRSRQIGRIHAAASEYLAKTPLGQLSNVRFDLAVVDGTGEAVILKNAYGHI
ncbi:MAG: YraN family protein [Pseudomonadota bacterium]